MSIGIIITIGLVAFFTVVGFFFVGMIIAALLSDDGSNQPNRYTVKQPTQGVFEDIHTINKVKAENNARDKERKLMSDSVEKLARLEKEVESNNKWVIAKNGDVTAELKALRARVKELEEVVEDGDKLRKIHAVTEENNRHQEALKVIKGGTDKWY